MEDIPLETRDYLDNVLKKFSPGLRYVCAYGSGVFKQAGHKSINDNMIDLIFVVNNSHIWHDQNLSRYPDHYSFLKRFTSKNLANIQENYGAKMYYNTRVLFDNRLLKYGVIDVKDFNEDLLDWNYLYLAGRLQKPVFELKGRENKDIDNALENNLKSALEVALLMNDEKISFEQIFLTIAGFSYLGDLRMVIGEDKMKVKNIVLPNIEKFKNLYKRVLNSNENIHIGTDDISQDLSFETQSTYLKNLPNRLRNLTISNSQQNAKIKHLLSDRTLLRNDLTKNISTIVRSSSTSQTIKGVFTAGFSKSIFYSLEKLQKMIKSLAK